MCVNVFLSKTEKAENDKARYMGLHNGWNYDGAGFRNSFCGSSGRIEIMFKIITVGASLFAAPAMAQTITEKDTVDALIVMVAAEVACGLKVPQEASYRMVKSVIHLIPEGKGGEFGDYIREAGEAKGRKILKSHGRERFCIDMAQAYRRHGY